MNADVHALAGAYALDALPQDEAAVFAEHVAQCPTCQQEVAELQVTATQLGLAVTQMPPAALRDRVLRAAHQTRQVPPAATPAHRSTRRRTWTRVLAAAAAAVVIVGGGLFALLPQLDEDASSPQEQIAAVMEAPDAHSSTAEVSGGGTITVVSSQRRDGAVVLSENLPTLGPDEVYQLWLIDRQGTPRSADVLIEGAGPKSTDLVTGVRPGDSIAITREPAGGSEQPSMAPLAAVERV